MVTTKPNSIFLIISLLFLLFLLPLFFITKTSLEPNLSFYLNFFPTTPTQFTTFSDNTTSEIKYDLSNATIHPNPRKTNKDDTFIDNSDTFVDNNRDGIKYDVSNATKNPNPPHKTSKGDTFVDREDTFVDNNGDGIKYDVSNATDDPNPIQKTNKDDTFVDKEDTFVDKGDTFEDNNGDGIEATTEIRYDGSNATNDPNTLHKTNKGDTFVEKNGEGIESSQVQEVVLSNKPRSGSERSEDERKKKEAEVLRRCNLYEGKWVKDEEGKNYPIYKPGSCPYVDEAYDCQRNGRLDSEYLKWRWKPDECELPRFSSASFLERLRGKRLMLIGDSMNRNQFESLLCMIWEGLSNKSKMYEIHGYKISKGRGYFVFRFEDYDCSVEFVRSHFLVKEGVRLNAQGNSNPTLSLDIIDKSAGKWRQADILIFNTGHWWTHGKTARGTNYYKEGDNVYPYFDAVEAYRRAMKTWAKWIDANISSQKLVIYRGYSSAHFRGGDWDSGGSCNGEKEPVLRGAILDSYPLKMKIVEEVIKGMKSPVVLLNVTKLTNFRKDGHPSVYGKALSAGKKASTRRQDCSHWCLPGVPDAWNELVLASMVVHQTCTAT